MVGGFGEAIRATFIAMLLGGMACGGCVVGCGMKYGDTVRAKTAEWIAPTPPPEEM